MRISDWSSDVCSSDLDERIDLALDLVIDALACVKGHAAAVAGLHFAGDATGVIGGIEPLDRPRARFRGQNVAPDGLDIAARSEERRVGKEGVSPGRFWWVPYH